MRRLAAGTGGDTAIIGGESGVAGLAGLLAACASPDIRERLRLDEKSRVLLIGSEGATDPEVYAQLVGKAPHQVSAESARP